MTREQKARKVAEEIVAKWLYPHPACIAHAELIDDITTALLQFAQEQESEAVGELVAGLEIVIVAMKSDGRDVKFGEMTILESAIQVAAALVARHSKKGAV